MPSPKLCCFVNYVFFCHHCNWKMCQPCFQEILNPDGAPVGMQMIGQKHAASVYARHDVLYPSCKEPKIDYEFRNH